MTKFVDLYQEDQCYEINSIYARLWNGQLDVIAMTYEKMGESYGLLYELSKEDTGKLEDYLGVDENGLMARLKSLFSSENADSEFRDYCTALGLSCRCSRR